MFDMRSVGYKESHEQSASDLMSVLKVADLLIDTAGGMDAFIDRVGRLLRRAVDEVIDMPRTGRWSLDELDGPEKTYVGTKVEILFRHEFQLKYGDKMDLRVGDYEVDIKNTIKGTWMIPSEAIDHHCLLIQENDKKATFSVGVVFCSIDVLTKGMNRDQKRSISQGHPAIYWICRHASMPPNFFEALDPAVRAQLIDRFASGAERIRRLLRLVHDKPFSRWVIESIAQQQDPLKRLRKNGGARDVLEKEGILILGGKYDRELLEQYGYGHLKDDEWVAVKKEG
jgi:hypothetical protein